jgi:hypothetical protein
MVKSPGEAIFAISKESKKSLYTIAYEMFASVSALYDVVYEGCPLNGAMMRSLGSHHPEVDWLKINADYLADGRTRIAITNVDNASESTFGFAPS